MLDSALRTEADAAMLVLDYPSEFTGERKECDLLLELYCAALQRHGKTGFVTSAFPELLPAHARERLHAQGVAALQGVEDGLAAWGRIAGYQRNRHALLALGESALVPLCPQALEGEGRLLNEWDSKQALKAFGLPTPNGVLTTPDKALKAAETLGYPLVLKAVSAQCRAVLEVQRHGTGLGLVWQLSADRFEYQRIAQGFCVLQGLVRRAQYAVGRRQAKGF